MTHRTEQILSAVETNVTGLTTTAGRVFRDMNYDLKAVPALVIKYGGETKLRELSTNLVDWTLFFSIETLLPRLTTLPLIHRTQTWQIVLVMLMWLQQTMQALTIIQLPARRLG